MDIDLQQLAVALIMLVPGFITTSIQKVFAPRRFSSDLHWTISSLLLALTLNLFVLLPFILISIVSRFVSVPSPKDISSRMGGAYAKL